MRLLEAGRPLSNWRLFFSFFFSILSVILTVASSKLVLGWNPRPTSALLHYSLDLSNLEVLKIELSLGWLCSYAECSESAPQTIELQITIPASHLFVATVLCHLLYLRKYSTEFSIPNPAALELWTLWVLKGFQAILVKAPVVRHSYPICMRPQHSDEHYIRKKSSLHLIPKYSCNINVSKSQYKTKLASSSSTVVVKSIAYDCQYTCNISTPGVAKTWQQVVSKVLLDKCHLYWCPEGSTETGP